MIFFCRQIITMWSLRSFRLLNPLSHTLHVRTEFTWFFGLAAASGYFHEEIWSWLITFL